MKELNNEEKQKVLELYDNVFCGKEYYNTMMMNLMMSKMFGFCVDMENRTDEETANIFGDIDTFFKTKKTIDEKKEPLEEIEKFFETRDLINIIDCLTTIKDLKDKKAIEKLPTMFPFQENGKNESRQELDLWNLERLKGNLRQLVALCDTTDLYELKNIYDDLKNRWNNG